MSIVFIVIINYILFSYTEDYFLSAKLPKNVLENLRALSGKTPEFSALAPQSSEIVLKNAKEMLIETESILSAIKNKILEMKDYNLLIGNKNIDN